LLASGVPVFAVTDADSELSKLLEESGLGAFSHTWDFDSVVSSLSSFVDKMATGSNVERAIEVKSFVNKHFNVVNLVNELESV
jgi:hypothetical protein